MISPHGAEARERLKVTMPSKTQKGSKGQEPLVPLISGEQRESHAHSAREVWRLHGPTRVAVAVLHSALPMPELRVFFEPESLKDLLAREVGDERRLLARAAFVKTELLKRGWVELGSSGATHRPTYRSRKRLAAGVSVLATIAAVWSWRRR